jgi:hypothetical protein
MGLGCFCQSNDRDLNIKQLKDLANNWIMNDENIEKAQILISNFSESVKEDDGKNRTHMRKMWYREIDGDTSKKLVHISKLCVVNTLSKHLELEHIKNILKEWEGDNFDSIHYTLSNYTKKMRDVEDVDLVYFDSIEDLVKFELGLDLYKRLVLIIHFFEKFQEFKRSVSQTC